jgi:hypothetical protein
LRRCLLLLLTLGLCTSPVLVTADAQADEQDARRIRLTDGRQFDGIVLQSTAEGMLLQVPQGTTLVPYASLAEIAPISVADFLAQRPIRVAIAPVSTGKKGLEKLARHLDSWVLDAARTLPSTELVTPDAWQAKISGQLSSCRGYSGCLHGLAKGLELDYLLIPTLSGKATGQIKLAVTGLTAGGGTTVAATGIMFKRTADAGASLATATELVGGVFAALGFEPGVDVSSVVEASFTGRLLAPGAVVAARPPPAPKPEPVAEAKPEPEVEVEAKPVAEAKPEPEPEAEVETKPVAEAKPEPEPEAEVETKPVAEAKPEPEHEVETKPVAEAKPEPEVEVETKPVAEAKPEPEVEVEPEVETKPVAEAKPEPAAAVVTRPPVSLSRGQAVALGFLPIPGLSMAVHGDKAGFAVSLAGTLATSWAAIYLIGRTARTEAAFWTPTVLVPYAINIAFNQISLLVHNRRARSARGKEFGQAPRVTPSAAPLLSVDAHGRAVGGGAGFWLQGQF